MSNENTETIDCSDCGKPFVRTVLLLAGQKFGSGRCIPCIETFTAETQSRRTNELRNDRETAWQKVCPASYRDTNPDDPRLSDSAKSITGRWDATRGVRGIGLIGSTGLGKTRCLFLALRRAHDAGRKVTAITHTRFSRIAMDAYSGNAEEKGHARDVLRALARADVLLFDDLGKAPSTERADSEMEGLVEDRTSHGKPILWSANGSGEWLIRRFGDDRGGPTVRRLAEFCDVVTIES